MIHYMLLPKEEMKLLRKEYRLRLCIIALFFISCAVVVGIIALVPAYLEAQQKMAEAQSRLAAYEKSEVASGANQIEKELIQTQVLAEKILAEENNVIASEIIQKIVSHRSNSISLFSFQFSREAGTSTPTSVVVQGRAATRENLLAFKKALESDKTFSAVDLPLSDLAKSRNISFTVRFTIDHK